MTHRFAAALTLAFSLSIPAVALADVPPADGGTVDDTCTVSSQEQAGTTCETCEFQVDDSGCQQQFGGDYSFACARTSTEEVWCNGPPRSGTPSPGCALQGAPAPTGKGAMVATLLGLVAAVWVTRRRRRAS